MPGRPLLPSRTLSALGAWTRNVTLRSGETSVDANSGGRFPFGPCARAGSARPEQATINPTQNFDARIMTDLGEENRNGGESLPRIETPRHKGAGGECPRATGRVGYPRRAP